MKSTTRKHPDISEPDCKKSLSALEDSLYVIGGKWKLRIIIALSNGNKRFNELQRTLSGISARVLSNELKDMEMNGFVKRNVYTERPVVVKYELTSYSDSLHEVLEALMMWGVRHREKIKRDSRKKSAADAYSLV